MSDIEVVNQPEPYMSGKFALFKTPDGGLHLSYIVDGEEDTRHVQIPPMIFAMAEKMANGESLNPMSIFQAMRGK